MPPRGRADIDDPAARALLDQLLRHILRHQELALQGHGHHPIPFLLGNVEKALVVGNRDVVDEDVDAPEAIDHGLHQRGHLARLRHVGDEGLRLPARSFDGLGDALAAGPVQIRDRHLGALGGEQFRDFLADIATAAGDDRDLILELHWPLPLLHAARVNTWRIGGRQECGSTLARCGQTQAASLGRSRFCSASLRAALRPGQGTITLRA